VLALVTNRLTDDEIWICKQGVDVSFRRLSPKVVLYVVRGHKKIKHRIDVHVVAQSYKLAPRFREHVSAGPKKYGRLVHSMSSGHRLGGLTRRITCSLGPVA
jgi:hypothetical protein